MALVRPFTTIDGVFYPEAYSRVITVRVDKNSGYVFVCTYADEDARIADALPIFAEEHSAELAVFNGDVFSNAYTFIKSRPGYENAVDHIPEPVLPEVTLPEVTTTDIVEPVIEVDPPWLSSPYPPPPLQPIPPAEIVVEPEPDPSTMN